MRKIIRLFLFISLLLVLVACSPSNQGGTGQNSTLAIKNAWCRPGVKDGSSAAFFVLENRSDQEDKMIGVSTDVSGIAEMHITKMDGGVMQMIRQDSMPIPARSSVEFKSGGNHIMIMDLKKDLKEQDTVKLTLTFEKSGQLQLNVPVRNP